MLRIVTLITCLLLLNSCKNETNQEVLSEPLADIEMTAAESIASKHGLDKWHDLQSLSFTFNVDRGEVHIERSYTWNIKTDDILYVSGEDTLQYNRKAELDSLAIQADRGFVNDSYWLLAPFKLVWDEGTTLSESQKAIAPISGDSLNKISITYGASGGYTPGDAYDLFFGDDYVVKEWIYRRGNAEKPSMMTRWSEIKDINGLQLATMHTDSLENFKLYFTNLSAK